nr:15724_t:CDS:2 [Entrophospora candida]
MKKITTTPQEFQIGKDSLELGTLDKIKLMHGDIINEDILKKVKKLPLICMLTHRTNLDLYYYDKSKNNSGVFIDLFSLPLPLTKYTSEKEEIFLIGMVIFERVISSIQPAIKELNQSISKPIDPTRFLLLTPVEDRDVINPSPKHKQRYY